MYGFLQRFPQHALRWHADINSIERREFEKNQEVVDSEHSGSAKLSFGLVSCDPDDIAA